MTAELATYRPRVVGEALVNYQDAAVQRLGEWAHSADAAYAVAERLSQSSFVPQQFRGKPVELTAAILAGMEVGLSPMTAMRSFDVINNQAAPRAITLRAIVQSYGHEMILVESTNTRCRMKGRRRGSDEWQGVTWTTDRARDLGLMGKDNWKKQPAAMLIARATSELARLIASDAILGIGYSIEEIADGGSFDEQVASDTTAPAPSTGSRRMSRTSRVAEADVVDINLPDDGPDYEAEVAPGGASEAQRRKMFASFSDAGWTTDARTTEGREERLRYISNVVGREVTTSNDLTGDEMGRVIDALEADVAVKDETLPDPTDGADPWAES